MTQRYELTDVQRCDLRIGSIEGVERLLRGETVADFLEEFWGLWKVVHGESLARPRASRRGRAAPVGYQDFLVQALEHMIFHKDNGGRVASHRKAREQHLKRLNKHLTNQLARLEDVVAYAERPLSITDRAILLQMGAKPRLGPSRR